jgi:hypothetical protein
LLDDRVSRRSTLLCEREQAEPNNLASIEQMTLSPQPHAKFLDPISVLWVERKRRVL